MVFPIPKVSGTHADVLAAIGLADLLEAADVRATLLDNGPEFQVTAAKPVTVALLRRAGLNPGYEYLLPNENERAKIPAIVGERYFDYPAEKEKTKRWRDAQKAAKAAGPEVQELASIQAPDPRYGHYMVLNVLQGDGPLNKSVAWIYAQDPDQWAEKQQAALESLVKRIASKLDFEPELVQLFNPQAAKGYARLKPDTTSRNDSTKDVWRQPLLEWFRFRGYFQGTIPVMMDDDVRILSPEPRRISYRRFQAVMGYLRKETLYGAAVKVDCLGTLAVAQSLVKSFAEFPEEYGSPAELLSGLSITHYKSLGQAKAAAGLSRLAVPGWFRLETANDVANWTDAINDYRLRLSRLNDTFSDELLLLILFRRYLEGRGPETLLRLAEFHEAYGIYLIRERGKDNWKFPQFSVDLVEKILSQEKPYSDIIQNSGFQALAKALRSATVSAQARKRNKLDYREIRYDILPELRRKRSLSSPEEFIDALSEFVAAYNAESAKRLEQGKNTGTGRIDEADFAEFLSLYDHSKNPSMVGALLCAYATCKTSNPGAVPEEPETPGDSE